MPVAAAVRSSSLAACATLALLSCPLAAQASDNDHPADRGAIHVLGGDDASDSFAAMSRRGSNRGPGSGEGHGQGHGHGHGEGGDDNEGPGHGMDEDNHGPRSQPQGVSPVPEPQAWLLMLGGLAALASVVRRRR